VKLYSINPLGQRAADFLASGPTFNRKVATGNFPSPGYMFQFLVEILIHCRNNIPNFKRMTAYRLEIRTSQKPQKDSTVNTPDWPLQTFVHFLDMTALRNICITQDYFTILTAFETNGSGWTGTICWDALVYLQRLKAKDTGRRKVKRVNDAVSKPAISINKYIFIHLDQSRQTEITFKATKGIPSKKFQSCGEQLTNESDIDREGHRSCGCTIRSPCTVTQL